MTAHSEEVLDVAIVGGGISGLYAGWRLLTGDVTGHDGSQRPKKVRVFEWTHRIGGRFLTWRPFPANPELHAELGGMRFYQEQGLMWGLIVDYFGKQKKLDPPIKFHVADPNGNNIWYLRESNLKAKDLTDPAKIPYRTEARVQYARPDDIINDIIKTVLVDNWKTVVKHLKNRTRPRDWKDWDAIKPHLVYRGFELWDIGFWNLLWDVLSPEAYNFITDAFGYYSLTNNWNAAEALHALDIDFTHDPEYYTLKEGLDRLPFLLCEEFEAKGGKVELNTRVKSIDKREDGLLEIRLVRVDPDHPDNPKLSTSEVHVARHVILAMPRRSLELLGKTDLWDLDHEVDEPEPELDPSKREPDSSQHKQPPMKLRRCIESVIVNPAFKLFLTYETPWWRKAPISIAAGRTVSDQPIRQTYYFPPVADGFPADEPPLDGPGLIMASYTDLGAVSFWSSLEPSREREEREEEKLREKAGGAAAEPSTDFDTEARAFFAREKGFYYAPPEMVRYAQEQLQLVHFNQPVPDPIYMEGSEDFPYLAAFKDWSHEPFGGGWNFWAPSAQVSRVMRIMRKPFKDQNLYIVGEAYSGMQGWGEGALTTTEKMLREHFHLEPAAWQPVDCYMGY